MKEKAKGYEIKVLDEFKDIVSDTKILANR